MLIFIKGMNPADVLALMQKKTGTEYVGNYICYERDDISFYPETSEDFSLVGMLPKHSFVHVLEDLGYDFDNN